MGQDSGWVKVTYFLLANKEACGTVVLNIYYELQLKYYCTYYYCRVVDRVFTVAVVAN
jgi:hypothetical protein